MSRPRFRMLVLSVASLAAGRPPKGSVALRGWLFRTVTAATTGDNAHISGPLHRPITTLATKLRPPQSYPRTPKCLFIRPSRGLIPRSEFLHH
ncbi:hypothetical protein IQ06DRAFT_75742 [Phaeosphaeriaceae sp. SRC1lsM3a]|nr:hypothetical protein IQ06DRAFT_75742 [Stagonospora sp. SRC1lsM3a]